MLQKSLTTTYLFVVYLIQIYFVKINLNKMIWVNKEAIPMFIGREKKKQKKKKKKRIAIHNNL